MRITAMLFGLVLLFLPASVAGQGKEERAKMTAEKCRWATGLLRSGEASPRRDEAMGFAPFCGPEGGIALAAELRRLKATSDTVELKKDYYRIASIRDAEVYRAAIALVNDPSATADSRIIGLKLLISYAKVHFVSAPFGAFLPDKEESFGVQDHFGRREGTPLPPGWKHETLAMLERLAADPAQSDTIRHAARRSQFVFRE